MANFYIKDKFDLSEFLLRRDFPPQKSRKMSTIRYLARPIDLEAERAKRSGTTMGGATKAGKAPSS